MGTAPAYGESKRLLGVDQIRDVILTVRDGRSVGVKLRCGEFSALLDGPRGAVCCPRCGVRAGVPWARRWAHRNRRSFNTLGSSWRSEGPPCGFGGSELRCKDEGLTQCPDAALPAHRDVDSGHTEHHRLGGFGFARFRGGLLEQGPA